VSRLRTTLPICALAPDDRRQDSTRTSDGRITSS